MVLASVALASFFLGCLAFAYRDASVPASVGASSAADAEGEYGNENPVSPSGWPLVGGFALSITAIGLVTERFVFLAGIFLLAAVTIEWMVRAWSDRASANPEYNQSLRDQVLRPLEYPLFALLGGGIIVMHLKFDTPILRKAFYTGVILALCVYLVALSTFHFWGRP